MDEDDAFYARFVEPLEGRMLRAVRRVLHDPEAARDAVQDAVLRLWKGRERVRRHVNPEALVLRVCLDAAVDRARRECRRRETGVADLESRPGDPARGPTESLERRELHEAVLRAIAALPPRQAVAVLMRVVEDQPYTAIARALGCAEITARVHVLRGRSRLARVLAPLVAPAKPPGGRR